jgi:hypothetical protein
MGASEFNMQVNRDGWIKAEFDRLVVGILKNGQDAAVSFGLGNRKVK